MVQSTALIPDKIAISCNITKYIHENSVEDITSILRDNAKDPDDRLRFAEWSYRRDYRYVFLLPLDSQGSSTCRIGIGGPSDFRAEWNPCIRAHSDLVWHELECLFGIYFETFLERARVTRLDLAYDVFPVSMDCILLDLPRARKSREFISSGGRIETLNLGSRNSDTYIRVYDKTEELRARGQNITNPYTVRVEAQLKPKCLLRNLQSISNPFEKLRIGRDFDPAYLPPRDYLKVYFIHYARAYGLLPALQKLPKKRRSAFRNWYNDNHSVAWHDSACLWTSYQGVVRHLLPNAET